MTDSELKFKCLELAQSGTIISTLAKAQEYYDWVKDVPAPKKPAPKKLQDKL